MKKRLILTLASTALMIMAGCVNDKEPEGASLMAGDTLPKFDIVMNNGRLLSTESLMGKTSVIVFFNTGCPDCREELPVVNRLWETYRDDADVAIIAVSREEGAESVEEYWEENNLSIPWSAQESREVYSLFAKEGIPRIYISDPAATIITVFTDSPLPSFETLLQYMPSPPADTSKPMPQ